MTNPPNDSKQSGLKGSVNGGDVVCSQLGEDTLSFASSETTPCGEQPFGSAQCCGHLDCVFRTKKKHKIVEVEAPSEAIEYALADTHVHLSMLRNPGLSLARAAAHGVDFVCCISDPSTDAEVVYSQLGAWEAEAGKLLARIGAPEGTVPPRLRIACGCHPHEARHYNPELEVQLEKRLADPRTSILGEIGLDYHYDFSSREVQREVFRRQLQIAHKLNIPVALHLREAHDDPLAIMDEEGFPRAGTILHCFNLGADVLAPWVERGCYVAVGGAVTFASSEQLRAALADIPSDRLLFETDGPFMAPVPFRGCECASEHLVFTAAAIAGCLGIEPGPSREVFLAQVHANALRLLEKE